MSFMKKNTRPVEIGTHTGFYSTNNGAEGEVIWNDYVSRRI